MKQLAKIEAFCQVYKKIIQLFQVLLCRVGSKPCPQILDHGAM